MSFISFNFISFPQLSLCSQFIYLDLHIFKMFFTVPVVLVILSSMLAIMLWNLEMFWCRFDSSQLKQKLISSITNFVYELQMQRPEVFYKKGVLRNFAKFTGKYLCHSLFFNKVTDLRPATSSKKRLWHRTPLGDCFWNCQTTYWTTKDSDS